MRNFIDSAGSYIRGLNLFMLFLCFFASVCGLVLIYSATFSYNQLSYVYIQAAAIGIGIFLYISANLFDTDLLTKLWGFLLFLNLAFLSTLYFWGFGDNNRSWLRFGPIGIQPAEVGKLIFILTFARHLHIAKEKGMRIADAAALTLHAAAVMGFVFYFSRDDGMTLAYAAIAFSMSFLAGVPVLYFITAIAGISAFLPYAWRELLDDYQRGRILAVFDPELYPDEAYQAMHSRMAIRAGGIFGEGYLSGTQTQYGLIPTKHTDSIFPVAGEEFGLLGCILVILLLLGITAKVIYIAYKTERYTEKYICAGVAAMLLFQTVLNLGMNLGLFPIVGLTLPFFSYGGSSIVTMFASIGIVSGIGKRRELYKNKNFIYIRRLK